MEKPFHPGAIINMTVLAEHQRTFYDVYSGGKEWSHLPDIHWFPYFLPDSYNWNVNGAWEYRREKDIEGKIIHPSIHLFTQKAFLTAII